MDHSTSHTILQIRDKIQKAIEAKKNFMWDFLGFEQAFDTVNHKILLKKLYHYGISGVAYNWFTSYLSNRKQFVSIGNGTSDLSFVTCGVPQGSVLVPLLFLLYINDFNSSAPNLDFFVLADDSNLFLQCQHESLQTLELKLNNKLQRVNEWFCANRLSLIIDKSNFVNISPSSKKDKPCYKN